MRCLITGGCGFIGCNTVRRLRDLGHAVTVLDNLSRAGAACNLEWLRESGEINFVQGDVRDRAHVSEVVRRGRFDVIIHLASQVAVTTSVADPVTDLDVNLLGTFHLLEAVRRHSPHTMLLNASTNKVYGNLDRLEVGETATRYHLPDRPDGVDEAECLSFHSPYGCSKGAAEQYVLDYARVYGLRTVNFRQSCIYGWRQFGVEDQGWLAWFVIAHLLQRPLTIYGTGKQVRDVLFIDDLVDAYLAAVDRIDQVAGVSFNIGGGPENTLSLLELMEILRELSGRPVSCKVAGWRPGDQLVYVSDIRQAQALLGWRPRIAVAEGVERLYRWIDAHRSSFDSARENPCLVASRS